jgi:hypothetical protein
MDIGSAGSLKAIETAWQIFKIVFYLPLIITEDCSKEGMPIPVKNPVLPYLTPYCIIGVHYTAAIRWPERCDTADGYDND